MRVNSLKQGDSFGRLKVKEYSYSTKRRNGLAGERVMLCECECGNEVLVRTSNLKSGNTTSCGCYHSERTIESNISRDYA